MLELFHNKRSLVYLRHAHEIYFSRLLLVLVAIASPWIYVIVFDVILVLRLRGAVVVIYAWPEGKMKVNRYAISGKLGKCVCVCVLISFEINITQPQSPEPPL